MVPSACYQDFEYRPCRRRAGARLEQCEREDEKVWTAKCAKGRERRERTAALET